MVFSITNDTITGIDNDTMSDVAVRNSWFSPLQVIPLRVLIMTPP